MATPFRVFRSLLPALILAALIVACLTWVVVGLGHWIVWPWAEENQGTLSFAALAFALIFALVEMHRANTEAERRLAEFVAVILELADEYATDLRTALATPLEATSLAIPKLNHNRALKRKTLDLLRQSCPPDGRLVLLLTELDQIFEDPVPELSQIGRVVGVARERLEARASELANVRGRVAARR